MHPTFELNRPGKTQPKPKSSPAATVPTASPAAPAQNLAALIAELKRIVADPLATRAQLAAAKRAVFDAQRGTPAPNFDADTQVVSNQTRSRVADNRFAQILKAFSH